MSEEKASPCVLHIHGEKHTGAAQRHVCHSIYLLGPGRKAGGRFGKGREAGSGAV